MQTVVLNRRALRAEIFTAVMTGYNKAIFLIVCDLAGTNVVEFPTTGLGINVYVICEGVFAALDLSTNLLAFPQIPIGNTREFGLTLGGPEVTGFAKLPLFAAGGAKDVSRLLGLIS